jgi:hypothetical protein
LNIAEYDEAEAAAVDRLPNLVIQAFQPEIFALHRFAGRVTHEGQLWRFADAMQEGRKEYNWGLLGNGLTEDEFDNFRDITAGVDQIGMEGFDRRLQVTTTLLRAIYQARLVSRFDAHTVLEVGPGSGYLGLLLMLEDYEYVAVDSCQAFYLWQAMLWKAMGQKPRAHLTWWDWVDYEIEHIDLIAANHVLCEMHPNAVAFLGYRAQRVPNLVFDGWGWNVANPEPGVAGKLSEFGFTLLVNERDYGLFSTGTKYSLGKPPDVKSVNVTVDKQQVEGWLLDHFGGNPPPNPNEIFLDQCKIRTV